MEAHSPQFLKVLGRQIFQFDNIAQFIEPQQHWCSQCDQIVVDTNKPETGKWFQMNGSIRQMRLSGLDSVGDWETVIFALCNECLNNS